MFKINSPEAYRLALLLAGHTGESITTAVTVALRERLDRIVNVPTRPAVDEIMAIGRCCAAGLKHAPISVGDYLYNEAGLPH